jgi:hypothetical protein
MTLVELRVQNKISSVRLVTGTRLGKTERKCARSPPLGTEKTMKRILFVGQKPETVDFSDPSLPPGFDAETSTAYAVKRIWLLLADVAPERAARGGGSYGVCGVLRLAKARRTLRRLGLVVFRNQSAVRSAVL